MSLLKVVKLTEHAIIPSRGSENAAGLDLYSAYDYVVPSKGKMVCKTDLQISVPEGSYGRIAPRSGLAANHFISLGGGVLDSDYRGNVCVILFNFGESAYTVKQGARIAQLICEKIYLPKVMEVDSIDATPRGTSGFGSTGQ